MAIKAKILTYSVLFIIASLIIACGNERPVETAKTEVVSEDTLSTDEMMAVTYTLPSPLQIASIFKKSGLKYQEDLTSKQKDPANYMTNMSKALNLGVYSADLSYALLNKQNQTAMEYMKLSRQIAGYLGIGSVYEVNDIAKRFEQNIGTEDSLTVIISELQMEMDFYLDENNQQEITAIAFAGAWIESMYIASEVNKKTKQKKLNKKFAAQMEILESILNALKVGEKHEPEIRAMRESLQKIQNNYEGFPSVKRVKNADEETEKIELSDDELALLSKEITALRWKFVNGEF
ncbi:MAG: hypothetical protein WAQ28_05325 [Bacteroidia bacterium]|jgi:hypothetical protein